MWVLDCVDLPSVEKLESAVTKESSFCDNGVLNIPERCSSNDIYVKNKN